MISNLDVLLRDIGEGANFDLDAFIRNRVERIKEMIEGVTLADVCYRAGLRDGVVLRHVYGHARGGRR